MQELKQKVKKAGLIVLAVFGAIFLGLIALVVLIGVLVPDSSTRDETAHQEAVKQKQEKMVDKHERKRLAEEKMRESERRRVADKNMRESEAAGERAEAQQAIYDGMSSASRTLVETCARIVGGRVEACSASDRGKIGRVLAGDTLRCFGVTRGSASADRLIEKLKNNAPTGWQNGATISASDGIVFTTMTTDNRKIGQVYIYAHSGRWRVAVHVSDA